MAATTAMTVPAAMARLPPTRATTPPATGAETTPTTPSRPMTRAAAGRDIPTSMAASTRTGWIAPEPTAKTAVGA